MLIVFPSEWVQRKEMIKWIAKHGDTDEYRWEYHHIFKRMINACYVTDEFATAFKLVFDSNDPTTNAIYRRDRD